MGNQLPVSADKRPMSMLYQKLLYLSTKLPPLTSLPFCSFVYSSFHFGLNCDE